MYEAPVSLYERRVREAVARLGGEEFHAELVARVDGDVVAEFLVSFAEDQVEYGLCLD